MYPTHITRYHSLRRVNITHTYFNIRIMTIRIVRILDLLSKKSIRSIMQYHYLMLNIGYVFPRQEHHRDVKRAGLIRDRHESPEPDS